jgi:hypothetical protein
MVTSLLSPDIGVGSCLCLRDWLKAVMPPSIP